MCGPSERIKPDLNNKIEDIKINKSVILVLEFINNFLFSKKFIKKIPEMIINNRAFVCLVALSENGFGYSNPSKYSDIFVKNLN